MSAWEVSTKQAADQPTRCSHPDSRQPINGLNACSISTDELVTDSVQQQGCSAPTDTAGSVANFELFRGNGISPHQVVRTTLSFPVEIAILETERRVAGWEGAKS